MTSKAEAIFSPAVNAVIDILRPEGYRFIELDWGTTIGIAPPKGQSDHYVEIPERVFMDGSPEDWASAIRTDFEGARTTQ